MTTATTTVIMSNSSNANFRAWGSWMSSTLTTLGFPKTADTGQVDWTTVTAPGAGSTSSGYEIRTFNDSLQSTSAVYFKLEWGSGTNASTPQMWITVGSGSDGAGTITGSATVARATITNGAFVATSSLTTPSYAFADSAGTGFAFAMWPSGDTSSNAGWVFGLERWRDSSGSALSAGVTCYQSCSGNSAGTAAFQRTICYLGGATQASGATTMLVLVPNTSYTNAAFFTASQGTTLYPQPVWSAWHQRLYGPSQLFLALGQSDVSSGSTFSVNHYGTSRTFLSLGPGHATYGWGYTSATVNGQTNLRGLAMAYY
jgi:hypothetical protein